jgi:large subunit ribosomal protein L10
LPYDLHRISWECGFLLYGRLFGFTFIILLFVFMKTKAQKQEAIDKAEHIMKDSTALAFIDFSSMPAEDLRTLRRLVREAGSQLFVIKKRLLQVIFKQQDIGMDMNQLKVSVGTVFSPSGVESVAGAIYRFFKEKGGEKEKLLGGYDLVARTAISQDDLIAIGQLPSREVLLGQLFGTIAGPVRAFLYLLDQKSKKS